MFLGRAFRVKITGVDGWVGKDAAPQGRQKMV